MNKNAKSGNALIWIFILAYLGLGLYYYSLHQLANSGDASLFQDLLTGGIKLISNGFRY
jgi:hypothetical protein